MTDEPLSVIEPDEWSPSGDHLGYLSDPSRPGYLRTRDGRWWDATTVSARLHGKHDSIGGDVESGSDGVGVQAGSTTRRKVRARNAG